MLFGIEARHRRNGPLCSTTERSSLATERSLDALGRTHFHEWPGRAGKKARHPRIDAQWRRSTPGMRAIARHRDGRDQEVFPEWSILSVRRGSHTDLFWS